MYKPIEKFYKKKYPFKLCTTSYIYPDNIIANVTMLAPYLDEIELILFESSPESLPGLREIKVLRSLADDYDITFNVHLPLDIFLGSYNKAKRIKAVETIEMVMGLTSILHPSTHTLHFEYDKTCQDDKSLPIWQDFIRTGMEMLIARGIKCESLSIETLMYPFEWVENIIRDFNLKVCLDLGHLILQKKDIEEVFNKYFQLVPILHVHGVENNKDHISLDRLSQKESDKVINILKRFSGVVSLEVFSFKHLIDSLQFIERTLE